MTSVASPGLFFAVSLALWGCSKTRSPEAVGQAFVDAYYIERDHQKALSLSTGAAAERVRNEAKLVDEGRAVGASASPVQPRVYYKFKHQEMSGPDKTLIFSLTIDSAGVELKKEVRLRVRQLQDREYRVSFFAEVDMPSR